MTELLLIRQTFTELSTVGELFINGVFECYTLEDKYRSIGEQKIFGETCIPNGKYNVELLLSPKRGYIVPWIMNVPNFSAIEIHIGNYPKDTNGCVLVGQTRGVDAIFKSKLAFDALMIKLLVADKTQIEIIGEPNALQT